MNRFSQLVSSGHLIFLGWKNLSELPAIINTTDAGLVSRRPCLANDFVATAGMLQYLACGKPVIAPDLRTVADVVSRGRCGILFRYWSQHDFAEAIELLKSNPLMRADLGRNAREAVVKEYSKHVVSKQLADALIDLHRFAESK